LGKPGRLEATCIVKHERRAKPGDEGDAGDVEEDGEKDTHLTTVCLA